MQTGHTEAEELAGRLREALGDRYTLAGELGRGSMAIVYRAFDLRHGRDVAIKVLRPELRMTVTTDRFLQEIRIAAQLQHPHILPLHDSGHAAGLLYYVMPYVQGESLRQRLVREQQLPIAEAIRIVREVASALAYAHDQGVVHRDIKPENILFSSGQAIVTDFGIARAIVEAGGERVTESGLAVGTPAYMSPEQAGGEARVDGRSDIYALGCVLHEILVGEPPFTGPTPQAVLARHMHERPPSLSVVRPQVAPELEEIVNQALAKIPADRFSSAAEFAQALFLVEDTARLRRLRTRRKLARFAIAGTVAAAGGLGLWLTLPRGQPRFDPNRVIVFPLVERGFATAESGVGYDVALMIGAALEHTDPLKWIDGWQYLDERRRSDVGLLTLRAARATSRERRARYFLEGVVRRDADSAAVVLRLHDAAGDSVISQETATGAAGGVPAYQLGLTAIRRLLPRLLAPDRGIELGPLSNRRPAAIALWIQGEREYRRAQFAPALGLYRRAVHEDSNLVFAAVKGAQAASWIHSLTEAKELLAVALARDTLLPLRYRSFARGLQAYLTGEADSALVWLEQALKTQGEWEEAYTALGQLFHQLFPSRAPLDSLAEAAFTAALSVDSSFTPPMFHLLDIGLRRGDTRRARSLMERVRRADPDSTLERRATIMLECVERGPNDVDWEAYARSNMIALLSGAKALSVSGAQPTCGEAAFRAILAGDSAAYRWGALLGLNGLMAAQGRTAEVTSLLDSAITAGTSQALWLYVLNAAAGLPVRARAAAMEAFARQRYGDAYQGAGPHTAWLLGIWHAGFGSIEALARLHRDLENRAATTGSRLPRLLADALAGHLALARGDTADAIARLRSLRPNVPSDSLTWSLWESLPVERLKLARLLLARGEHAEALRVAAAFDHQQPIVYLPFLPASLALRLQAAQALGRSQLASTYRIRLLKLGRADLAGPS
ncbi:MAG: protein kinase [Gemmatimonadetes bacterium]|nr:protein kinase [Gemmatimonadota bacterium]